jgi:5-(carboxyamino)imidazole ribonucleotide synthase
MTVGILGGGQLARMLGLAGIPMGLRFIVFDPAPDVCGAAIGRHIQAQYDDWDALRAFAEAVDVVTYEFENVPVAAVAHVEKYCRASPDKVALHATQDRLRENRLFQSLDIATPTFLSVDSASELQVAAETLGYPLVLKSRSGGYDGKGQVVIRDQSETDERWSETQQRDLIAEEFVPFDREVSIIGARGKDGDMVFYDIAENTHTDGILRISRNCPDDPIRSQAEELLARLFDKLGYVGVLALECFQVEGRLLANEYAPRVHNTGHWTIDGAITSQFENHLRAILDMPLGDPASTGLCVMVNCIGDLPEVESCLAVPDAHFHSYDKAPRPGRKVGHVTVRATNSRDLEERERRLLAIQPKL